MGHDGALLGARDEQQQALHKELSGEQRRRLGEKQLRLQRNSSRLSGADEAVGRVRSLPAHPPG